MNRTGLFVTLILLAACNKKEPVAEQTAFADAKLCTNCHPGQAKTYRETGMGQSFRKADLADLERIMGKKATYFHAPSDRYYEVTGGKMRRYQKSPTGQEINVVEDSIDYVVGSGHHARTFLHREPNNRLAQLPVSWYTEKGGGLAMSPGYDSPRHPDFRRKITGDCFACHNAYPTSGAGGVFPAELPQGIDCQRCHGPGQAHISAVQANRGVAEIRQAIVNPKRLAADRQMDVCLQCHLETTSFELPNSLLRQGQDAFSYRPGQPLAGHHLQFDHAPGTGHDDKFEIAGAAYRLRQSACFLKSGKLSCTTCHNPHDIPRGEAATKYYATVCRSCHSDLPGSPAHNLSADCVGCHMPKRRTEDVVHVVMTDHLIQRRKPARDLLAARAERHEKPGEGYRGPVVPYYPRAIEPAIDQAHYLGLAQVTQASNLAAGIVELEKAAQTYGRERPQIYVDLAAAYATSNALPQALATYRLAPATNLAAQRGLGSTLLRSGDAAGAVTYLQQALTQQPDAATQQELGRAYLTLGRLPEAVQALQAAVQLDPDLTEARDALGNLLAEQGNLGAAEQELREAIRRQPDFANAYGNLAKVLLSKGSAAEAEAALQKALALEPGNAPTRYNYGVTLAMAGRFAEAETQVAAAIAAQPDFAEAQETLGNLFARRREWARAAGAYRQALKAKPQFGRAHLGLGTALAAQRDLAQARTHLREAANDPDPAVRQEAAELLKALETAR